MPGLGSPPRHPLRPQELAWPRAHGPRTAASGPPPCPEQCRLPVRSCGSVVSWLWALGQVTAMCKPPDLTWPPSAWPLPAVAGTCLTRAEPCADARAPGHTSPQSFELGFGLNLLVFSFFFFYGSRLIPALLLSERPTTFKNFGFVFIRDFPLWKIH